MAPGVGHEMKSPLLSTLCALLFSILSLSANAALVLGDVAPYGQPDSQLNAGDLVVLQRFIRGDLIPTATELLVADVAPLGSPDGVLNAGDLVVLLRAVNGQVTLPNPQPDPPTLTVSGGSTETSPYTVTGATDPTTQINLYVNGQYQNSATSDGSGNFSIQATLNEGTNDLYVTATVGGVESSPSTNITVNYSYAGNDDDFNLLMNVVIMLASLPQGPPPEPDLNLITVSYVAGGQITVSGSAGATVGGYQVTITTNVGYTETVTANANGSFSATFALGGASSMTLYAVNGNGVSSNSVTRGIGDATEEGLNAEVLAVWNGFCDQLRNANATGAANYFSLLTKDKYQELLGLLGSEIANLPGYWSSAIPILLEQDVAEYAVTQTVNGQERLHLIGFIRDDNGQWLIEQF